MSASVTTPAHEQLPTELPPNAGRAATGIAIVLVAQLMLVLDATVVNVALPRIDSDLGFGPASLSWVLNAYTLAFGGLLLLGGRLGDVRGRLRLFEIGLALFTVASVLGGLAQTPGQLVAARAAQGVGAALAAPSVLALLTTSAPDEAARQPGARPLRRGLLRRRLARPAPRRLRHRRRLLALDAVHQRPDRAGGAAPGPPLRHRDPAPPRPLRRRRRGDRHPRRGLPGLGAHRHPGARLDLGPDARRLRRRPRPARRSSPPPSAASRTR